MDARIKSGHDNEFHGTPSSIILNVMAGLVPAIHACHRFNMAYAWLYIMTNKPNGILYVGVTGDIQRRAWEHREGKIAGFTKHYDLKRLIYTEAYDDIQLALQRETNMKLATRLENQTDTGAEPGLE